MMHDDYDPKAVARHQLASVSSYDQTAYINRGRYLSDLSQEVLVARFVQTAKDWVATPHNQAKLARFTDVEAEFDIRKIDAPYQLVEAELDALNTYALQTLNGMSPSQKQNFNDRMVEEFGQSRSIQH